MSPEDTISLAVMEMDFNFELIRKCGCGLTCIDCVTYEEQNEALNYLINRMVERLE